MAQVLQETAAARLIQVVCGKSEMNGHNFCLGLQSMQIFEDGQGRARSVLVLMKGAIFRDKYEVPASGKDALNIGPLGELIDLYQKHLTTEQHDKIYALLGMCSDSPNLDIDYRLPWATLMERVLGHVASKAKIIPTRNSSTGTAISSKGCILGHILSVKVEGSWGDEWRAEIMLKFPEATHDNGQTADWVFQSLAEDIEEGDIICLLLGNGTPTIIRQRHDHFVIIAIAVNSRSVQVKGQLDQSTGWLGNLQGVTTFRRDLLLLWKWDDDFEPRGDLLTESWIGYPNDADKMGRLLDVIDVLEDSRRYYDAHDILANNRAFRKGLVTKDTQPLVAKETQEAPSKSNDEWSEEEIFIRKIIALKVSILGRRHPRTQSSMDSLASVHRAMGRLKRVHGDSAATRIYEKHETDLNVTEDNLNQTEIDRLKSGWDEWDEGFVASLANEWT